MWQELQARVKKPQELESGLARRAPLQGKGRRIASRIPPGRLVWLVGGWVVFFVLVVFSVFYVFVGLVAVLGCLLVVWLLGCWFEQPNNPKKQPPNNPIIRQPSYQTTQEHNNPTTQTNRFHTKKSKRQTTKNTGKSGQGHQIGARIDQKWSQNRKKCAEPPKVATRWLPRPLYPSSLVNFY